MGRLYRALTPKELPVVVHGKGSGVEGDGQLTRPGATANPVGAETKGKKTLQK